MLLVFNSNLTIPIHLSPLPLPTHCGEMHPIPNQSQINKFQNRPLIAQLVCSMDILYDDACSVQLIHV